MPRVLEIFVSGKERELEDERKILEEAIQEMGLHFIGSENRYASEQPVQREYLEEVGGSDIYTGIFYLEDSEASRNEFLAAKNHEIPALVFVKELRNNSQRNEILEDFLNTIKEPVNGVTYNEFRDIIDLRNKFKKSLVKLLSRRFRYNPIDVVDSSSGTAQIINFECPDSVTRGEFFTVKAKVDGTVSNGFLDFMTKDPNDKRFWTPDPDGWNNMKNKGKMTFNNDTYENSWKAIIPKEFPSGQYVAFMGLYEDVDAGATTNRRIISWKQKSLHVT